jgi:SAM-dependent methyltransferase
MSKPWHEDDAFWETFAPSTFSKDRRAAAPAEVDAVLALSRVRPPAPVLDLACGVGRHSLELARRGFGVTGVDRTRRFLEEASAAAEAEGLRVEWVEADMREFVRPAAFGLALSLFTSFGFFEDPADDLRVARNLRASLHPEGVAVLEMAGKEPLVRRFTPRDWRMLDDGSLVLQERSVVAPWRAIASCWILVRPDGARRQDSLTVRLYSAMELSALLQEAGFGTVEVYGSLAGIPYDYDAQRLVAVARV